MVLFRKFKQFSLMPVSDIRNKLFMLVFIAFKCSFYDFKLSSRLIKSISCTFQFRRPIFKLKSELCFKVLLDTHPKDICVNWQLHLLRHLVKIRLFSFNSFAHLIQSGLKLILKTFPICYFFEQSLLVLLCLNLSC